MKKKKKENYERDIRIAVAAAPGKEVERGGLPSCRRPMRLFFSLQFFQLVCFSSGGGRLSQGETLERPPCAARPCGLSRWPKIAEVFNGKKRKA